MFKKLLFFLVASIFCLTALPRPAFAADSPSFSSCTSPSGETIASYDTGDHGIVGNGSKSGSDKVYSQNNGALQCYCGTGGGIQTNWWRISEEMSLDEIDSYVKQGWFYVPDGSDWGLEESPYLAQNINYSCGGVQGSSTSNSSGGDNPAPVCNDKAPTGAPVLLSVVSQGPNSVKLTWTEAPDPVTYYLVAYGTVSGQYIYGNPNVGGKGTTTYTVTGLSGGVNYFFVVRAGNGCKPGPFSNELTTSSTGGAFTGPATGFESGVLGTRTDSTPSGDVKGTAASIVSGVKACANCFWWPILLGETIVLAVLYGFSRKDMTRKRWAVGFGVGIVALVIWWILNRGGCITNGGMNLILFTLPCWLFFLMDGLVWAVITLTWGKVKDNNPSR